MAYIIQKMKQQQVAPGVTEGYVDAATVVYVETVADAEEAARNMWGDSNFTVTYLENDMPTAMVDGAQELYPGQTADEGAVADIPDEMWGAGQIDG
jgi:hypothetical protein